MIHSSHEVGIMVSWGESAPRFSTVLCSPRIAVLRH